jgi:hypothetical protein
MRKSVFAFVWLVLAGCGRDRYEMVATDGGAAYRLDKSTGEVVFFKGPYGYRTIQIFGEGDVPGQAPPPLTSDSDH